MLIVKTKLGLSKIDGIGLFADEDILKGTIIWKENNDLSFLKFTEEEWQNLKKNLSSESFSQIKKYSYKYKRDNNYYLDLDDTRFVNHSSNPNIIEDEIGNGIAIKNIKKMKN